jgi:transmembrane sensor
MAEEPLHALPGRIQPQWSERRAAQVRAAIGRRVRRRRVTRWMVATSSLVLVGCLVLARFTRQGTPVELAAQKPTPVPDSPTRATPAEPTATPLTPDTELVVDPQGGGRAFVLRRGSARFVVTHDEHHPFRVRVGPLVVEDLGTVFSVERLSEHRFGVAVEEGRVAVLCESTRVELGSGQQRTFECGAPERAAAVAPIRAAAPPAPRLASERPRLSPNPPSLAPDPASLAVEPPPQSAPAWRLLAERGQYREAYHTLHDQGTASVRDETHDLLLAADTARLSGHPGEAVPYLRRVLSQHADDPRAHLAAFTLGRVLLDELGQPAEAAAAFERARVPSAPLAAPLAEDALARAIEAWSRAGDLRRAHGLALEYQRLYPQGRRLRAVSKFGALK